MRNSWQRDTAHWKPHILVARAAKRAAIAVQRLFQLMSHRSHPAEQAPTTVAWRLAVHRSHGRAPSLALWLLPAGLSSAVQSDHCEHSRGHMCHDLRSFNLSICLLTSTS